jgi:hypothetical protein
MARPILGGTTQARRTTQDLWSPCQEREREREREREKYTKRESELTRRKRREQHWQRRENKESIGSFFPPNPTGRAMTLSRDSSAERSG